MKIDFKLAWLSLTYKCNNRCVWCYAGSDCDTTTNAGVLDRSRQEDILGLMHSLGIRDVILIGGEPSIYPDLEELLRKTKAYNLRTHMVSNGRRFREPEFARRIKKRGLDYVSVSLEGANSRTHDLTTQIEGSYNETLDGIRNCAKEGIITSLIAVISSINHRELKEMVDLTRTLDLKTINFNISGVCLSGNNEYMIHPKEAVKAYEEAYLHAKSLKVKANLSTPMPMCFFTPELLPELKARQAIKGGPCQLANGRNFVIDYNGDILPCTHFRNLPLFNLLNERGIMSKEEFVENYESANAQEFRDSMDRRASTHCDNCKERCSGGCPLFWIKFDPEKEINDKRLTESCQK